MKNLHNKIVHNKDYNRFDNIAYLLMNQCILCANGNEYELMEIEFYFNDNLNHKDINTHCSETQKQFNTWYLHQVKKDSKSYKSGNRKGLDITFGDKNSYGGILIRGIKKLSDNTIIAGPSKCVDEIMDSLNIDSSDISELGNIISEKNVSELEPLNIKEIHRDFSNILLRGSRVRLVKNDKYCSYPYRYIKNDIEYRKHRNFKEKTLVNYYSLALGVDENVIKEFSGLKNLNFNKFLNSLNLQKKSNQNKVNFFDKLLLSAKVKYTSSAK